MQIPSLVSEVGARAVEKFKTSFEMEDLQVQFSQDAFIKCFELYQEKVAGKFPKLDLGFLDEASDDEVGPSEAAVGPPPVGTSSTTAAATTDLSGASSPSTSVLEV